MTHPSTESPPRRLPRLVLVVFVSAALGGCGINSCIDGLVKRAPKPIEGTHAFEVAFSGQPVARKEYKCEKYYDSMCAERGNYWAVREVSTRNNLTPSKLAVTVPGVGIVEFEVPRCEDLLEGKRLRPDLFPLRIDGTNYFYTRSEGAVRVYRKSALRGAPEVFINLQFEVTIDGKVVDWKPSR